MVAAAWRGYACSTASALPARDLLPKIFVLVDLGMHKRGRYSVKNTTSARPEPGELVELSSGRRGYIVYANLVGTD